MSPVALARLHPSTRLPELLPATEVLVLDPCLLESRAHGLQVQWPERRLPERFENGRPVSWVPVALVRLHPQAGLPGFLPPAQVPVATLQSPQNVGQPVR